MHHFSELDIWVVREEIEKFLQRRRVKRLKGDGRHFFLEFERGLGLFFSLDFRDYRVHLSSGPSELPLWKETNPLKDFRLKDVKVPRGERILSLLLSKRDPLSGEKKRILVLELTGKYTNLFLLDELGKILDLARPLDPRKRRVRFLGVGRLYHPPRRRSINLWKITGQEGEDYLKAHFPHFFEEKEKEGKSWSEYLDDLLGRLREATPGFLYLLNDKPLLYSPVPLNSLSDKKRIEYETFSGAVEAFYTLRTKEKEEKPPLREKREVLRERLLNEIDSLENEKKRARLCGETILRHIGEIEEGAQKVILEGMEIPLDPRISPGQSAERYFEIYKRCKRGIETLKAKLRKEGLDKIDKRREKRPRREERPKPPYLIFLSPSGFQVYVGKNRRGNEIVTFEIAGPEDYFFHVKDSAGAHVILKTGGKEPGDEDLLFAARLALRYSTRARDGKGVVTMTKKKHVRRPPGAPKGLVLLREEKSLHVRL